MSKNTPAVWLILSETIILTSFFYLLLSNFVYPLFWWSIASGIWQSGSPGSVPGIYLIPECQFASCQITERSILRRSVRNSLLQFDDPSSLLSISSSLYFLIFYCLTSYILASASKIRSLQGDRSGSYYLNLTIHPPCCLYHPHFIFWFFIV